MKINKFKTREERLTHKLNQTLLNKTVDEAKITELIQVINDYEKNNLDTISKLKKDKSIETRRILGGLKQTIHAHGPITLNLIGSATKRIYGNLLVDGKDNEYFKIHKSNVMLMLILILVFVIITFICLFLSIY